MEGAMYPMPPLDPPVALSVPSLISIELFSPKFKFQKSFQRVDADVAQLVIRWNEPSNEWKNDSWQLLTRISAIILAMDTAKARCTLAEEIGQIRYTDTSIQTHLIWRTRMIFVRYDVHMLASHQMQCYSVDQDTLDHSVEFISNTGFATHLRRRSAHYNSVYSQHEEPRINFKISYIRYTAYI